MIAFNVKTMDMSRDQQLSHISINMEHNSSLKDKNSKLQILLSNQPEGHIKVNARISKDNINANETRVGDYQIKLTDEFMHEIKIIFGDENVDMIYKNTLDNSNAPKRSKEDLELERARLKDSGDRTREQRHKEIASTLFEARSAMGT
jgi:hypothetical protein